MGGDYYPRQSFFLWTFYVFFIILVFLWCPIVGWVFFIYWFWMGERMVVFFHLGIWVGVGKIFFWFLWSKWHPSHFFLHVKNIKTYCKFPIEISFTFFQNFASRKPRSNTCFWPFWKYGGMKGWIVPTLISLPSK